MKGIKKLFDKVRVRALQNNYSVKEVLFNEEVNKMLLVAQFKPKLLK